MISSFGEKPGGLPRAPNWLPTLCAVCAVCAGVALRWSPPWAVAPATLCVAGVLLYFRNTPLRLTALCGALLFAVMGYLSSSPPAPVRLNTASDNSALMLNRTARFRGTVIDDPRLVRTGSRMTVELSATAPATPDGVWRPARGRVALTIGEGKRGGASQKAQDTAGAGGPSTPEAKPSAAGAGLARPSLARGDEVVFRARLRRADGFKNPGTLWYSLFLARKDISASAFAQWPGKVVIVEPSSGTGGSGKGPLDSFRQKTAEAISNALPGPAAAVIRAISLGDRSGISAELSRRFRQTGTAHLLAVSGLHLGIVALGAAALFGALFARIGPLVLAHPVRPLARLAALVPVSLFGALAGFQTSTVRALMMTLLIVAGLSLSRRTSAPGLLLATVLAVLVLDPLYATDPGLHLSIAALAGLFWLAPALKTPFTPFSGSALGRATGSASLWRRAARTLAERVGAVVRTAVAATLTTAPVAAFHFGQLGWAGMLYNPLAVPLIAFVALPLSLLGAVVSPLFPEVATFIWAVSGYPVELVLEAQQWVELPSLSAGTNPFASPWALGGGFLLLAALVLFRDNSKRWRASALAGLLLLAAPHLVTRAAHLVDWRANAWVLDVGVGQAVVARLPGPFWVLVDGGGLPGSTFDIGAAVVRPALKTLGCTKIDLAISSHPHIDHLGGLNSLVAAAMVRELWLPASFYGDRRYHFILQSAKAKGTVVRWVEERSLKPPGAGEAATSVDAFLSDGGSENDRGLLVRVRHEGVDLIIAGDVELEGQRHLLADGGQVLAAELLVAPHHGAQDAVDLDFLGAVSPRAVVVSCTDAADLPSKSLKRYCLEGTTVLMDTAHDGAIRLVFGGGEWAIKPASR